MKINKHTWQYKGGLASQSLASQLVFADVAEHDYRHKRPSNRYYRIRLILKLIYQITHLIFYHKDEGQSINRDLRFKRYF